MTVYLRVKFCNSPFIVIVFDRQHFYNLVREFFFLKELISAYLPGKMLVTQTITTTITTSSSFMTF